MYRDYWEYDNHLVELLLDSRLQLREIATEVGISERVACQRIKMLGLDWIWSRSKNMSRGSTALTQVLKKLIPGEQIVNEFHIGERLKLDIYCPKYKLAVEFHGRQHFDHVPFYHDSYEEFKRAQERDDRKAEMCKEQGITLVVFRYNDNLNEDIVYDRLLAAMQTCDAAVVESKPKRSSKDSPLYEQLKLKRKAYERDLRRKIKEDRKDDKVRTKKNEEPDGLHEDDYDEW